MYLRTPYIITPDLGIICFGSTIQHAKVPFPKIMKIILDPLSSFMQLVAELVDGSPYFPHFPYQNVYHRRESIHD